MMLLEHDAKMLLASRGVPVPAGRLFQRDDAALFEEVNPFKNSVVKAQVPTGGRGKAGGIALVESPQNLRTALDRIFGLQIKGHPVRSCRVEAAVSGIECYFGLILEPSSGQLRVLVSASGGVDIEAYASDGAVLSDSAAFDVAAIVALTAQLIADFPAPQREALLEAGKVLTPLFFEFEATMLEINPLFVLDHGAWVVGDVKLVIDDNSLPRQTQIAQLLQARAPDYPEAILKLTQGFDFVVLDEGGDIGLITTGAGLSMQLVDEIIARGHAPFNFCDIRTGQFRGNPARLVQVLRWISGGSNIRSVLMNFFAGITHLGELARLIVTALEQVPEMKAPITVRMIGNGYEEALAVFADSGLAIRIEPDLELALTHALQPLRGMRP